MHWAIKNNDLMMLLHLLSLDKPYRFVQLIDNNDEDLFLYALKYGSVELVMMLIYQMKLHHKELFYNAANAGAALKSFVEKHQNSGKDAVLLDILDDIVATTHKKRKAQDMLCHAPDDVSDAEKVTAMLALVTPSSKRGRKSYANFFRDEAVSTRSDQHELLHDQTGGGLRSV
jgi:hypothetical protein